MSTEPSYNTELREKVREKSAADERGFYLIYPRHPRSSAAKIKSSFYATWYKTKDQRLMTNSNTTKELFKNSESV